MSKFFAIPKTLLAQPYFNAEQKILFAIILSYFHFGTPVSSSMLSTMSSINIKSVEKNLKDLADRRYISYKNNCVVDMNVDLLEKRGFLEYGYCTTRPNTNNF